MRGKVGRTREVKANPQTRAPVVDVQTTPPDSIPLLLSQSLGYIHPQGKDVWTIRYTVLS